jgi:hypothetical protein
MSPAEAVRLARATKLPMNRDDGKDAAVPAAVHDH